ncbi:uncharacterized protein LOC144714306 [Wolffia australiana]
MSLLLQAIPLRCDRMFLNRADIIVDSKSAICPIRSWRNVVRRRVRGNFRVHSLIPDEPEKGNSPFGAVEDDVEGGLNFRRWDVPWDWKVTALVMTPYLMSIILSGIVKSNEKVSPLPLMEGGEEAAIMFFADQSLKAVTKLSVLFFFVSQHRPFPEDVFAFKWDQPFNPQRGWLLWAGGGLLVASCTAFLAKAILYGTFDSHTQSEGEAIARLLPFIGSSNVSTISLMGVLGVVAPVSEEILYRGFLLTSLTKWFPTSISIIMSSAVFTLAHLSPGKSLEIFIFGTVMGLVYAQTRNLLAPILMHASWNLGVILTLTILQMMGNDIGVYLMI